MSGTKLGFPTNASISSFSSLQSGMSFTSIHVPSPISYPSVKPKSTWIQLKPHFETLVSSFVFPQLTFNEHRQEMWESDPIDYIRTSIGSCALSCL